MDRTLHLIWLSIPLILGTTSPGRYVAFPRVRFGVYFLSLFISRKFFD